MTSYFLPGVFVQIAGFIICVVENSEIWCLGISELLNILDLIVGMGLMEKLGNFVNLLSEWNVVLVVVEVSFL